MDQSIEVTDCATLDEFWSLVSPIGDKFGKLHSKYIFRGQGNSIWELTPQVYRSETITKYKTGMLSALRDHPGHVFFEWSLLSLFISSCDEKGLLIPGDSMEFRRFISQDQAMNRYGINTKLWPEEDVIPLMALAQHHGIPTRLLDWTSNPYVGCYFAAESAIARGRETDTRIALFAIDMDQIHKVSDIKSVRVPGSTSVNISPQSGSFLLVNNSGYRGNEFPKDISVESKLAKNPGILKKITLPSSMSGDLLMRCHKFGISAASLFPGYDGAARAVLEASRAYSFNNGGN